MSWLNSPFSYPVTPVPITTGADPVTIDGSQAVYYITSGGTGGHEVLNVSFPPLDIGGFVNAQYVGWRTNIAMIAQTNGADVVDINVGFGTVKAYISNPIPIGKEREVSAMNFDYVGAFISLIWAGDHWAIDMGVSKGQFEYTDDNIAGDWAAIKTQNLPIADPHVNGQLYSFAGALMVSAG
jgi:hypothetical protein